MNLTPAIGAAILTWSLTVIWSVDHTTMRKENWATPLWVASIPAFGSFLLFL